jgi:murein DD-endopeptidase MepM/ murein hydrolase activator NlpD
MSSLSRGLPPDLLGNLVHYSGPGLGGSAAQADLARRQSAINAIGSLLGERALQLPGLTPTVSASGFRAPAPRMPRGAGPAATTTLGPPSGLPTYPLATHGKIIGTPYAGTHTLYGNWESDNAVDIAVPVGTPVRAAFSGRIGSQIGSLGSGDPRLAGLRVHVDGPSNSAYYQHLSRLAVKAGQQVKAGQIIGYSGAANGVAHLHFAVERGSPYRYTGR